MRKSLFIFILIFILILSSNTFVYSQEKQSSSSTSKEQNVAAKVVYPVGEVLIYDLSKPLDQPKKATVDMLLYSNYKIETKEQSSLEMILNDGTVIKISEKSIFEIKELKEIVDQNKKTKKSVFSLISGAVRAVVAKVKGQDSTFQITTPNGVASVRGTDLGIIVNPESGQTDLFVFKGVVAFGQSIDNQILVEAGKMASILGNIMSQVVDIPENVKNQFLEKMKTESPEPVETIGEQTQTQTYQIPEEKKRISEKRN